MRTLIPVSPPLAPQPSRPTQGIAVALYPSDASYNFEIQRATSAGGAGATTIASDIPGTQQVYIDALGLDNTARWYRIRHMGLGDTPGAWTDWVGGVVPMVLPGVIVRPPAALPSFKTERSVSGTIGTLTLTVTDPQSRVTLVEMQTTSGSGAASGWSTIAGPSPYATTVTIATPESKIEYRVTAFDANGIERIIQQEAIPFNPNALLVKITPVSTTSQDEQFDVTVTDLTGSAAITLSHSVDLNTTVTRNGGGSDPATFTGSVSGTTIRYTATRPDFATGKGKTQFKATATGRIDGVDEVDIPEKLRDTIPTRLSLSKLNYNTSTGNYELWFRYFQTNSAGTETENVSNIPWSGGGIGGMFGNFLALQPNGTGVLPTFNPGPFPGPSLYDASVPGWKVTWPSGIMDTWAFHMDVNALSDWTGATTVAYAKASLDVPVQPTPANLNLSGYNPRASGVIGDGSHDDTSAANAAGAAAASANKYIDFGSMIVKISGAVTIGGPGFRFDDAPHGGGGGPGFLVTGSGYTALTLSSPTNVFGTVRGTGNTAHGVFFNHPILTKVQKLRVYNLDGFGCKLSEAWDPNVEEISVELVGNSSNYGFQLLNGASASNHGVISRIQAEQCNRKAIWIDDQTESMTINRIHSEKLRNMTAGDVGWHIGGTAGTYRGVSLAADSGTGTPSSTKAVFSLVRMDIDGGRIYSGVAAASDIVVEVNSQGTMCGFNSVDVNGTFGEQSGNTGKIICNRCHMNRTGTITNVTFRDADTSP